MNRRRGMVPVLIPLFVFLCGVGVALSIASACFNKREETLPPGSNGLAPILGETLSFFKATPANTIGEFMRSHISRYGKIFSSNLLGRQAIISADVELNKFVQKNDMKLFYPVMMPSFGELFGGRNSAVFAKAENHKKIRSIYSEFLCMKRLQTVFLEDANKFSSSLVDSWQDGSIISAVDEALKYSLQLTAKSTSGILPGDHRLEMLQRNFKPFELGLISLPIKFWGTKYSKALMARNNIISLLLQILKERVLSSDYEDDKREENDLLGLLMKKDKFTKEQIASIVLMMIFAGHDSSSKAMAAMIYFLAKCPKAIRKLQEEHLRIRKSKQEGEVNISWEDYDEMEFTECVIKETLRLTSVAPFILRKTMEDVQYKGIVIPRSCLVVAHIRALHLDPNCFKNPEEFNPWRWLDSSVVMERKNFMPFGGGVKMCPGSAMAKLQMAVFLHHIILKYEWELVEEDNPVSFPSIKFIKGLPIMIHSTQFR